MLHDLKYPYLTSADPKLIALFTAIQASDVEGVRKALADGADAKALEPPVVTPEYPDGVSSDWPALFKAALKPGNAKVARLLIAAGAKANGRARNYSLIELASEHADVELVEVLMEAGAVIAPRISKTGLGGGGPVLYAAGAGKLDIVKALLARGATLDGCDAGGETSLHAAVALDHIDVVRFLLDKGADVNSRDRFGRIPLFKCSTPVMAELLLKRHADPDAVDRDRKKAVDAVREKDVKATLASRTKPAIRNKPPPRGRDRQAAVNQRELRKNLRK
jgi:Ankyrin repeats (3 copies)